MNKKDLNKERSKDVKVLSGEIEKKKLELAKESARFLAGKSNDVKKMRNLRRDIAQILTIIHERELQDSLIVHERELQDSLIVHERELNEEIEAKEKVKVSKKEKKTVKSVKDTKKVLKPKKEVKGK